MDLGLLVMKQGSELKQPNYEVRALTATDCRNREVSASVCGGQVGLEEFFEHR